jgi:hypothetical protein
MGKYDTRTWADPEGSAANEAEEEKRRINKASVQTKEKEKRVKNISQTLITTYQSM